MYAAWVGSAFAGAGCAWLLDRDSGKRRRGVVKDKTQHAWRVCSDALQVGAWDLQHVMAGRFAELQSMARRERASDRVVLARMRAQLGRHVSHPHAIDIEVEEGMARLHGPILQQELDRLLDALLSVRGVRGLESHLEVYDEPGHLPALQGGFDRQPRAGLRPAWRLLGGACGVGLLTTAALMRQRMRWSFAVAGGVLLWRVSTNRPILETLGIGAGPRLVEVHKSVEISASPEQVMSFLEAFENYPLFMEHVRGAEQLPSGHVRWQLIGPAKVPMTVETERVDDGQGDRIAWRSVGGRPRHEADLRVMATEDGARVAVRFAYTPPAGLAGHGVGLVTRTDPKHALDRDLLRLKSLLEVGKTTLRGQTVLFTQP